MSTVAARTAVASVVPRDGRLLVEPVVSPVGDEHLVELVAGLDGNDRAGFDCPLGWPDAFVAAVTAHRDGQAWPGRDKAEADVRPTLRLRHTDRAVHEQLGLMPLSVSADKLGSVAMRCAHVLDAAGVQRGEALRRDGSGAVVEVYPQASRRCWQLTLGTRDLDELQERAGLDFTADARSAYEPGRRTEHAFDALVAALTVRAHQLGLTEPVPAEQADAARREGWIILPAADSLARLSQTNFRPVRPGGAG